MPLGEQIVTIQIRPGRASLALFAATLTCMSASFAQEQDGDLQEVVVTGIRSSLASALEEKRASDNLIEVIQAEDIGKLPDQNLAEVLENVTGVQITRQAGVGTGVQIRGTNANRTEINGVSTVGSGAGRSGINFDDVSASIIAAVEVTKASEAKTIEGSVGGTINLKTIRPLALRETLATIRVQGEQSDLSADNDITPRVSGTLGNNWSTDAGDIGVVISGSFSEADVTAFRPRADRDALSSTTRNINSTAAGDNIAFDFLPIQFLNQDYDNFKYQTKNIAGSVEWAPNDELKFYFDAVVNEQERRQEGYRVQLSGTSSVIGTASYTGFETVDFGTLDSATGPQNIGTIQAATQGILFPQQTGNLDPNMRTSTDTGSRVTDSQIFRLGGEWQRDRLSARAEFSTSSSDTSSPGITSTLNFINPNSAITTRIDNGVPVQFDLTGGALAFGIAQGLATTPTTQMLLNPANYVLAQFNQSADRAENSEDAFRADLAYDLEWSGMKSLEFGYRYNESSSLSDVVGTNFSIGSRADAPTGNLFADVLSVGPDNYNEGDGRALYVRDFLLLDPSLAFSNVQGMVDTLNGAITANNLANGRTQALIGTPTSTAASFFDITEKTHALYAQANFEVGIFRGNFGVRYLETDVNSLGNTITTVNGANVVTPRVESANYDFLLPRLNVVAEVRDDLVVRAAWGKDIRRPDFDDLSTSVAFTSSENASVAVGNPRLKPEEVTSFDLSAEWYFSPGSVLSVGIFHKTRTDLHVAQVDDAPVDANGYRDLTEPCEGGGIYNPVAVRNTLAPPSQVGTLGMCVPAATIINGAGDTTQKGIEIAFQYDLARFEDKLGWASGFGLLANYTRQKFSGGETFQFPSARADQIFTSLGFPDASLRATLPDLSENAYNITLYYEKYGISSRVRYTWRDAYRTTDYASSGAALFGFDHVQEARGQINASVSYDVNDHFNVGLEAINLTSEDAPTSCVNEGALLCFQGITDRRITFGASYRF
ncbi:MAG: TonB-dependent receptor [Steroidobacteraceae bacterium]